LGDSPVDIFKSFFTQPGVVWQIAAEPVRIRYVVNLLMVFGFLSLPGGDVLLLALPVFLANLLSAYPAQYYGEFHYSAPLAPYAAAAAAFGTSRLWRWLARRANRNSGAFQHMPAAGAGTMAATAFFTNSRNTIRPLLTVGLAIWIVGWALVAYVQFGRGPGGGRYDPTPITAHHELLQRFISQVPDAAAVTATAAVHPHLSHRRYVYQFPLGLDQTNGQLGNAEWALLDVTTNTDMAPGDLYARVQMMLAGEWGVADGADGFLLLHKGAASQEIPEEFYSFVRSSGPAREADTAPLRFAGVTVEDWPRWRQSKISVAWHVGEGFDPTVSMPQLAVRTPAGETIYTLDEVAPPALLWYPPERWQAGETVRITTLPLYLPRDWGVAVSHAAPTTALLQGENGLALAGAYARANDDTLISHTVTADMSAVTATAASASETTVRFAAEGEPLMAQAQAIDQAYAPGDPVEIRLIWSRDAGWPTGVEAFVHLRGPDGRQAQQDGPPRTFVFYDADKLLRSGEEVLDWRQPVLPNDAGLGEAWDIVIGLYDPVSGVRLDVLDEAGNVIGNEARIGGITVGQRDAPDQACALVPATCASQ
jgi:hypothetical protein